MICGVLCDLFVDDPSITRHHVSDIASILKHITLNLSFLLHALLLSVKQQTPTKCLGENSLPFAIFYC